MCGQQSTRDCLEKVIVQHVDIKCVFIIQTRKRLISTNVKSAKPAAAFWIFLLRTKNRQLCCLAVMVHIVWQKRWVATTKNKTISIFEEVSPPIASKHIQTWTKKDRSYSVYGMIVSTPHLLIQLTKTWFTVSFLTFSVFIKETWFSQTPTTVLSSL